MVSTDSARVSDSAMRRCLTKLAHGQVLGRSLVTDVFREIMAGECASAQIGGLLMGLAVRRESMEEIVGAATAMREAMTVVPTRRAPLLDTCGTGGSGVPRRNVSTAVAIALAACGIAVAKHGNRCASSRCGSADVLEVLGVDITATPERVGRCIDEIGLGFLFAANLHPAMKHAAPVRRELGVRTIFNLLGPMTNPAGARRQLLGMIDASRCEPVAAALGELGSERVLVVTGADGVDDLSSEAESWVAELYQGNVRTFVLRRELAGLSEDPPQALAGGTPHENAAALVRMLQGEHGAYRRAVQYSGAAAMLAAGEGTLDDLPGYARRVGEVLDDGRAELVLKRLVMLSKTGAET